MLKIDNITFLLITLNQIYKRIQNFPLITILDNFGISIPRFCYHRKISASGNCRICVAEVVGSVKPLVTCCTANRENMIVFTNTILIKKIREFISEFLLVNHPLDCPICDQASECDLQDLAYQVGSDDGRYSYSKKAISNKNLGSFVKTNMNRCIYCTRCVRYNVEWNNKYFYNTLGRGNFSEIGRYTEVEISNSIENNNISGNVIDLCPVGYLSKFIFKKIFNPVVFTIGVPKKKYGDKKIHAYKNAEEFFNFWNIIMDLYITESLIRELRKGSDSNFYTYKQSDLKFFIKNYSNKSILKKTKRLEKLVDDIRKKIEDFYTFKKKYSIYTKLYFMQAIMLLRIHRDWRKIVLLEINLMSFIIKSNLYYQYIDLKYKTDFLNRIYFIDEYILPIADMYMSNTTKWLIKHMDCQFTEELYLEYLKLFHETSDYFNYKDFDTVGYYKYIPWNKRYFDAITNTGSTNCTKSPGEEGKDGGLTTKNTLEESDLPEMHIEIKQKGALTSKPYLFKSRSWEITSVESVDVLDSLCSSIRLDIINNVIERILPKTNDLTNGEWITDKIRFCYDSFRNQRISTPYYKVRKSNLSISTSWYHTSAKIKMFHNLYKNYDNSSSNIYMYTGHLLDVYTIHVVKQLCLMYNITNLNLNVEINSDLRRTYIYNSKVSNYDEINSHLYLGVNKKIDAPTINMKIKHMKYKFGDNVDVCYIGNNININYDIRHIGLNTETYIKLTTGKNFYSNTYSKSLDINNINFFHSIYYNKNKNIGFITEYLNLVNNKVNFICNTSTLFPDDIEICEFNAVTNYHPANKYIRYLKNAFTYILNLASIKMSISIDHGFTVNQTHHNNINDFCDVTLPTTTFIEKTGLHINCEGRLYVSSLAITRNKKMQNNENIIYNLFTYISIGNIRKITKKIMYKLHLPRNTIPKIITNYRYEYSQSISFSKKISLFINMKSNIITYLHMKLDLISRNSIPLSNAK